MRLRIILHRFHYLLNLCVILKLLRIKSPKTVIHAPALNYTYMYVFFKISPSKILPPNRQCQFDQ